MPYVPPRPEWVTRLDELEERGIIEPRVGSQAPTFIEGPEDPETGDVTLAVEGALPQDMTPQEADIAEAYGHISPQRAEMIRQGIPEPQFPAIDIKHKPAPPRAEMMGAAPGMPQRFGGGFGFGMPSRGRLGGLEGATAGSLKRMGEYGSERQQAIMAQAEAEAATIRDREQYLAQHNAEMADLAQQQAEAEKARRDAMDQERENIEMAQTAARYRMDPNEVAHHESIVQSQFATPAQKARSRLALEKASRVDPYEMFGEGALGIANKIVAAVATGIGGWAAGAGNVNRTAEIINKAIDRSVAEQRRQFQANKDAYMAKRLGYADMRQRFGDERSAELQTRSKMLEDAKRYVEQIAMRRGDDVALAKARELQAQLGQQQEQYNQEVLDRAAGRAQQEYLAKMQRSSMLQAAALKGAAAQQKARGQGQPIAGLERTGQPITEKDVEEVKRMWGGTGAAMSAIDRAIQLREEHDGELYGPVAAEMDVLREELVAAMGKANEAGTLQEGERELFGNMIGNLKGHFNPYQVERLRAVKGTLQRQAGSRLKARGYQIAGRQEQTEGTDAPEQSWFSDILGPPAPEAIE